MLYLVSLTLVGMHVLPRSDCSLLQAKINHRSEELPPAVGFEPSAKCCIGCHHSLQPLPLEHIHTLRDGIARPTESVRDPDTAEWIALPDATCVSGQNKVAVAFPSATGHGRATDRESRLYLPNSISSQRPRLTKQTARNRRLQVKGTLEA